ncbi:MAG: hypothetical protein LWW87_14280 [Geobacteraceae bacterium]|nr:hypothetical protein [Geobacteraceae bacterium]
MLHQIIRILLSVCLFTGALMTAHAAPSGPQPAPHSTADVEVFNRTVVVFRAPLLGVPVEERARRASEILQRMLATSNSGKVTLQPIPQGISVMLDGVLAFTMVPEDADPLKQESLEQAAKNAVAALELVVRETREARDLKLLMHATGFVLAATLAFLLLVWLLHRARKWLTFRLASLAHTHAERLSVGGESLMNRERLLQLVRRAVTLAYWALVLFLFYDWLGFTLGRFPYTRPWGERLTQYLRLFSRICG